MTDTTQDNEKFRRETKGSIIRVQKQSRFTVLDNTAANDSRLSFKAVGIHTYLMTKQDNWAVYANHLADQHTDGRESVLSGLRELEECGYLIRRVVKDERGRITGRESVVFEVPQTMPEAPDAQTGKPVKRKTRITENPYYGKSATSNYSLETSTEESKEKDMSADADAPAGRSSDSVREGREATASHSSSDHPTGGHEHSAGPGGGEVPGGAAALVAIWNAHRGPLPEVLRLNKERTRKLDNLRAELGADAEALWLDAVRQVAADEHWQKGRYGLDNLIGKVLDKAEKYRAGQSATPTTTGGPLRRRRNNG